jgi:ParB family chromosome partitioning protein
MTTRAKLKTNDGSEIFLPLNKLKKSPRHAQKVPHTETAIASLAASISYKGMLQNLVVEPEVDEAGAATGYYLVTIGEGRRLAQLLRVQRKEIRKSEPIREQEGWKWTGAHINYPHAHGLRRLSPSCRSLV